MVLVFNMEIASEQLAKVAKYLVIAHILIFATAALGGALTIVALHQMQPALDDLADATGGASHATGSTLRTVVQLLGHFAIPGGLIFLACLAIKGNDTCLFQCLSCTDGFGVCLQIAGLLLAITFVTKVSDMQTDVYNTDCSGPFDDANPYSSQEQCLDASANATEILSICHAMSVASAVLSAISAGFCLCAALQAKAGHEALINGEVFVGPPNGVKPPGGQAVQSPVQPPQANAAQLGV